MLLLLLLSVIFFAVYTPIELGKGVHGESVRQTWAAVDVGDQNNHTLVKEQANT
jgi:hypothetical protein